MKRSDFIFVSVQLMYYKCHKVCFKCGGSYTDSPDWIKKKKATINLKNKDDKCFQYAVTGTLKEFQTLDCLTVSSCHVTYAFRSESKFYSFLNVKELFTQSRREI